jgi:hypothetical protein
VANVSLDIKTVITLDADEFRLITAALRGTLTEQQRAPALALQEKMLSDRASQATSFATSVSKHVENIAKPKNP